MSRFSQHVTGWYKNFKGLFLSFFVCVVTALCLCKMTLWWAYCRLHKKRDFREFRDYSIWHYCL